MEPPRFLYDLSDCPISRALEALGEKWTLLVIREAFYGVRRFDDFARALGCGRAILSDRLKKLTDAGMLERSEYRDPGQRPRAEYSLTAMGTDLFPTLLSLSQWGERWLPSECGPVANISERTTGLQVRALITSDPSIQSLHVHDLRIVPGPGAKPL